MPDVPPSYLRFMRPVKPLWAEMYSQDVKTETTLDIATVKVRIHRLSGFSVPFAYWPESWHDQWAIDELLEWEWPGWKNENSNRNSQYYADFIVDENQQANPNELRALESKSVRGSRDGDEPVVLVVRESVHRRGLDAGANVPRRTESNNVLRLERGVSGGYAADLSGEDD